MKPPYKVRSSILSWSRHATPEQMLKEGPMALDEQLELLRFMHDVENERFEKDKNADEFRRMFLKQIDEIARLSSGLQRLGNKHYGIKEE